MISQPQTTNFMTKKTQKQRCIWRYIKCIIDVVVVIIIINIIIIG